MARENTLLVQSSTAARGRTTRKADARSALQSQTAAPLKRPSGTKLAQPGKIGVRRLRRRPIPEMGDY